MGNYPFLWKTYNRPITFDFYHKKVQHSIKERGAFANDKEESTQQKKLVMLRVFGFIKLVSMNICDKVIIFNYYWI